MSSMNVPFSAFKRTCKKPRGLSNDNLRFMGLFMGDVLIVKYSSIFGAIESCIDMGLCYINDGLCLVLQLSQSNFKQKATHTDTYTYIFLAIVYQTK